MVVPPFFMALGVQDALASSARQSERLYVNQRRESPPAKFVAIFNRQDGNVILIFRPLRSLCTRGEKEYLTSETAPQLFQLAFVLLVRVNGDYREHAALRAVGLNLLWTDGQGYLRSRDGRFGFHACLLMEDLR